MEGEKFLKRLKDGSCWETLSSDVKAYLAPVCKHKTKVSPDVANKCGEAALKMLHRCVQSMSSLTLGSPRLAFLTDVAHVCYEGVGAAKPSMRIAPLSLEKVLFHIMLQLVNKSLLMDALAFAEYLYAELVSSKPLFEKAHGVDNEFETIAKQAFNQLWKACAQIEESTKTGVRHVLVLNARRKALAFVMLTNQEITWIANAALRAGIEMERHLGKDASNSQHLSQFFGEVVTGLLLVLPKASGKSKVETDSAKAFGPVLEVCLQFTKYSARLNEAQSAKDVLTKIKECARSHSTTSTKLVCAICDLISIAVSLSSASTQGDCKAKQGKSKTDLKDSCERLHIASAVIAKSIEIRQVDPALFQCLIETYELLRKQIDVVSSKTQITSHHSLFYQTISLHLDILGAYKEYVLKTCPSPTDVFRGMSVASFTTRLIHKQLATLNFLANLTIQELGAIKQGSNDEATREQYGARAVMVCKRTKSIMDGVSQGAGGVISVNEHRWLGSNAYNLGLICYKKTWYDFASRLVRLACEQLQMWCSTEQGSDPKKVQEIQLVKKYELLVDCQRRAGQHRDAMTTVALSLLAIPGLQHEDISSRAEQWVKAKRDALKITDDPDVRNRTLLDACQDIESELCEEQLSVITSSLMEELKVYKTQRHDTSVEQYAVIQDLLRVFAGEGYEAERAATLIQLAQLVYFSNLETESSSEDFCRQAVELLESLPDDDHPETHSDLLAQAAFWGYLCQLETSIQNSKTSTSSSELTVTLNSSQESSSGDTTAAEDESLHPPCTVSSEARQLGPFHTALQLWNGLLQEEPLNLEKFHAPSSTVQCLQLAADIMAASDKPLEEIWALSMVSRLAHATASPLTAHEGDIRLSRLLAQAGLIPQASQVIGRAEEGLRDVADSKKTALTCDVTLAKCFVLFYSGQVQRFEESFTVYLGMRAKTTKHRTCHTYLNTALVKELHSLYLSMPASQRTTGGKRLSRDEHGDGLTPVDLDVEAMRTRMGVAKIVMGTGMGEDGEQDGDKAGVSQTYADSGQHPVSRWLVIASVLDSLSRVAQDFTLQGCVREAQCYITEGISLAQRFHLPRRCARFLEQLIEIHVMWGQEEECYSTLNKLKSIIKMENDLHSAEPLNVKGQVAKRHVKKTSKKKTKQSRSTFTSTKPEESDEEDFIKTRPLSVSKSLASQISVDMSTSPSLKPVSAAQVKLPNYATHSQGCACHCCGDLSLHEHDTAYCLCLAKYCRSTGCYDEAAAALRVASDLLDWSQDRLEHTLIHRLSLLKSSSPHSWTRHMSRACEILSLKAQVELEAGNIDNALSTAREGLSLSNSNSNLIALHPSLLASFHYCLAVGEIQRYEKTTKCVPGRVFDSSWTALENDGRSTRIGHEVDGVADRLTDLSLSVVSGKASDMKDNGPTRRLFQNMLDTSVARPEMTRQRESRGSDQNTVLPEELGLFTDVAFHETDGETQPAKNDTKATKSRSKSAVQVSTKKGAINFKVSKKVGEAKLAASDPVVATNDSDGIYSFDEDSVVSKSKAARGRGKKGVTKQKSKSAEATGGALQESEVVPPQKQTSPLKVSRKSRTKKGTNAPAIEADEQLLRMVDDVIAEFSDSNSGKAGEEASVKPKRGRGRKAKVESKDVPQEDPKPRARRGRAAKSCAESADIENTRGIPDPEPSEPLNLLDDTLDESLPIVSLPISSTSPLYPESPAKLDLSFDKHPLRTMRCVDGHNAKFCPQRFSSVTSESSVVCPLNVSDSEPSSTSDPQEGIEEDGSISMLLSVSQEDFDDIEMPRAGSDTEEPVKRGRRRGRVAKKDSGKGQTKVLEDVEAPRRCSRAFDVKETKKSRANCRKTADVPTMPEVNDQRNTYVADLQCIKGHLEQAYGLMQHLGPSPLYRRVCQLLALCHGDRSPAETAGYLAEASAVTLRHQKLASLNKKLRKLRKASEKDDSSLSAAMETLSLSQSPKMQEERLQHAKKLFSFETRNDDTHNIVEDVLTALPAGYTVCQLSVVSATKPTPSNTVTPSSQLLVTRLQKEGKPLVVRLPLNGCDRIIKAFEGILIESKETVKETDKRLWWTTRQRLDEDMMNVTQNMENTLLSCWKGLVLGGCADKKAKNELKRLGQRLQELIQEASQREVDADLCECLVNSHTHLSHSQTIQAMSSLTGLQSGSETLTELAASLEALAKEWEKTRPSGRNPVILILDSALQQLPWESMPILQAWPVCRLPSLHFLLSHLRARDSTPASNTSPLSQGVNPDKTYFVLNPTGDLLNTQKTFQNWFQKEKNWSGVVGRAPTKAEYASALSDHDLFVFCGHGTGREFLGGDDIQRLTCRAATLLIGCSSGRLQVNGCLEASGMALNYLLAECPCVVANLWDVTDRDIDRFLEYLLKAWLATASHTTPTSTTSQSLASLLTDARQACKLKHLIGFAPVVYGLPVTMQEG